MDWINAVVQGILVGGLYALFATGLSLIFGIMRLVNIAHGDLIVLASFLGLVIVTGLGLYPLVALLIVVPLMFALGYALQRGLHNFTHGTDIQPPLLVTYGLSINNQNALLEIFSADSQKLPAGPLQTASMQIAEGLAVGVFPVIVFACAVVVIAGLQLLLYRTALGAAFRATSDDPDTARLMGIDNRHIFALAMAISLAVVALAGVFLGMRTAFDPSIGPGRLIYAFEAVIIGGLGSLWGTLVGGIVLGVSQIIGGKLFPGADQLAGHVVFLIILVFRPRGLFPRAMD
ncbi:MAG: branched-chain amino acid ABC transporter permease [Rhodospirillaceae bacterium]|nr:branched-chain amino acid ABC transporter permease [Rhodospirillaceae bacterium]